MVFKGGPVLTLDGKGRITVPARWRELLMANVNGQLVITKHKAGCLSMFPLPVWEKFETELLALPQGQDKWRRFFQGNAAEVEIDSASRVLIPPDLRNWAGLKDEVKFMGMGSHFELWDLTKYTAVEDELRAEDLPESLGNVVIR